MNVVFGGMVFVVCIWVIGVIGLCLVFVWYLIVVLFLFLCVMVVLYEYMGCDFSEVV